MRIVITAFVFCAVSFSASAQSFTCNFGKEPACLDYSDKVCSSYSKCVSEDAACFDSYQCDYEGFTCKSNVTECVEKHDALVRKYNDRLYEYDELATRYNELVSDNETLAYEYDALLSKAKKIATEYNELKDCLTYATDMNDVQVCVIY